MKKQVDKVNQNPGESGADVFEAIHAIMHLFRARQMRVGQAGALPLTHMENKVLGYFGRHPGATQRDLAAHSGRDKAQLARLIGGLRDKGLLDAVTAPEDRRSTHLRLSEAGSAVHAELRQDGARLAAAALTGIDETERAQLLALLARVHDNLATGD
ncbi:MarR family winged helix-turn-helix transcriptional regulator [Massilia sp. S19_KUP03_FR1]|uniref:MarR family winged helix-turn-helix transcriptional regulator n=1 Tax=Massilia sp. S19_KUP03_FR1 TaxID=3025503 RepID=UPI002FCD85D3